MTRNTQIRLSQFITTYGVGSLIEIPDIGPCIILNFKYSGLFDGNKQPNDFLISNFGTSRLSKRLLYRDFDSYLPQKDMYDKIGIFELPSNANYDRNIPDTQTIFKIKRYPNYALCEHECHPYGILHSRYIRCPICETKRSHVDWNESNRNTIRFVSICPKGHLNDINWNFHVHREGDLSCKPTYYLWISRGTDDIQIRCPNCQNSANLRDIMIFGEKCQCFWPEEVPKTGFAPLLEYRKENKSSCDQITQIMPRNSTSIFVSEVITAISTPLEANEFYKILNYNPISTLLKEHSNKIPLSPPPTIGEIDNRLKEFSKELKVAIENQIKMKSSTPHNALDALEEVILKTKAELKKNKRYLKIIEKFASDHEEIKKVNNLIEDFYKKFLLNREGLSEEDFRREELNMFMDKSTRLNYPDVNRTLIVDWNNSREISFKNLKLRIVPIPRLEVVMVQQGYKRICYRENAPSPRMIPTPYIEKISEGDYGNWYPAVRLKGEGIFIELLNFEDLELEKNSNYWQKLSDFINLYVKIIQKEDESIDLSNEDGENDLNDDEKTEIKKEKRAKEILKNIIEEHDFYPKGYHNNENKHLDGKSEQYLDNLYSWIEKFLFYKMMGGFIHPIGIWWHTFSHRLMKSISIDCGYTLASIRERIYINIDSNGIKAGLLLYSGRAGLDGTTGGLIYQVPRFERIIERAIENLDICSNDPICGTNIPRFGQMNGAACYACLFLPETSCEFGNIGLDRNILINTIK